jgi:hypothetical protein
MVSCFALFLRMRTPRIAMSLCEFTLFCNSLQLQSLSQQIGKQTNCPLHSIPSNSKFGKRKSYVVCVALLPDDGVFCQKFYWPNKIEIKM